MPTATWNGQVIASSDHTEQVEGNHYFPPDSIDSRYFVASDRTSVCGWKGTASYYDVVVDGQTNAAAAWYYADPKPKASGIKNYVAFWNGITVED